MIYGLNQNVINYTELFTDLTPFIIYYAALFVRIFDNLKIFKILFFEKKPLICEFKGDEDCPLNWENPMAKSHHEFIFTNVSVSFIIVVRYIFFIYGGETLRIYYLILALGYLLFSIVVIFIGLKIDWKGVDSIFFSLIAMSAPYFTIFTILNINLFTFFNLSFPAIVALVNFIFFSSLALIQRYVI